MVNLNQPIRITTTRVLLVAGVGMLMLLHKQAQHHAALPSHPHAFGAPHGPDHIRRQPAPPVTMPPGEFTYIEIISSGLSASR